MEFDQQVILDRIQCGLPLRTQSLADILGVSCIVMMEWEAGKPIPSEYHDKLTALADIADYFHCAGVPKHFEILRRKILNGKNFCQLVYENGDFREAAQWLMVEVMRELADRKELDKRMARYKIMDRVLEAELPGPNDPSELL